ncbi:hypothetical protein DASB73_011190 [Starmerella bacillaris]|uniref:Uncharacterized protein n=1 Tax=Starmerella bacillaris TaxID=1247836 RepID=A0AAV5RF11_STABA|nr:hypothetical protein DASB73_011190 [Starmerella bacillaris]
MFSIVRSSGVHAKHVRTYADGVNINSFLDRIASATQKKATSAGKPRIQRPRRPSAPGGQQQQQNTRVSARNNNGNTERRRNFDRPNQQGSNLPNQGNKQAERSTMRTSAASDSSKKAASKPQWSSLDDSAATTPKPAKQSYQFNRQGTTGYRSRSRPASLSASGSPAAGNRLKSNKNTPKVPKLRPARNEFKEMRPLYTPEEAYEVVLRNAGTSVGGYIPDQSVTLASLREHFAPSPVTLKSRLDSVLSESAGPNSPTINSLVRSQIFGDYTSQMVKGDKEKALPISLNATLTPAQKRSLLSRINL